MTTTAQNPVESPDHKRFRSLLAKIEAARQRLQVWQLQLPVFAQSYQERAAPIVKRIEQSRRAWVFELADLHDRQPLSAKDKQTLAELICEKAGDILDAEEGAGTAPSPAANPTETKLADPASAPADTYSNAALKALYNRFAQSDFDSERLDELNDIKHLFEAAGGLDLGDAPVESVEDLMRRAREDMQRRAGGGQNGPFGGSAFGDDPFGRHPPGGHPFDDAHARPSRSGSGRNKAQAKAHAAQRRAEEDAKKVSQTVREVYRKLAAVLHPDRMEPGASAAQQQQRTTLMAQANAAYEAGDLLALLNLQLQIEQVDAAHVAEVTAAQVKHFNKVLAEQLRELQTECAEREQAFCASYGVMVRTALNPEKLGKMLGEMVHDLQYDEWRLQRDRQELQGSVANLKRWLKQERRERQADAAFDRKMDDLFGF